MSNANAADFLKGILETGDAVLHRSSRNEDALAREIGTYTVNYRQTFVLTDLIEKLSTKRDSAPATLDAIERLAATIRADDSSIKTHMRRVAVIACATAIGLVGFVMTLLAHHFAWVPTAKEPILTGFIMISFLIVVIVGLISAFLVQWTALAHQMLLARAEAARFQAVQDEMQALTKELSWICDRPVPEDPTVRSIQMSLFRLKGMAVFDRFVGGTHHVGG